MLKAATSNIKRGVLLTLIQLCVWCFCGNIFAQDKIGKYGPVLRLANVSWGDYKHPVYATYEQILSDPSFVSIPPGHKVISFTILYQPKGKDYWGPYSANGNKFNNKQLAILKHFRDDGLDSIKVSIEDIKMLTEQNIPRCMSPSVFTIVKGSK